MELRCVQSPSVSSIPRNGLMLKEKPFLRGHTIIKLPVVRRACPDARRLEFLDFGARSSSGTIKAKSAAEEIASSNVGTKDKNLVFVAGATGKVGSRTVRELLKLGFSVRAGVRSISRAQSLVQSVRNMKLDDVVGDVKPVDKLELVECDLEQPDQIGPALDNASIVICCIGASEKEVLDITGPYRIDFQATQNLIDAATAAKVDHFILLTSLGTNKVGFPAAILNLFWGVLLWKRKAEEALLASGLPYSIVRPGGMERPTDSYKETHNMTLSEEDTLFGGQVSNLQVAELLAFMARNRSLSYCKVVEVIAETTAPLTPMGDLLKKIPSQREEVFLPQEPDNAGGSQPIVPDSAPEKEPEKIKVVASRPSSPYVAYEDLKPPTSPTPTQSTGSILTKSSKIEAVDTATSSSTSSSVEVNSSEETTIVVDGISPQTAPKKPSPLSPYINYEDLKPPSSPTPMPSTGSSAIKAVNAETLSTETSPSPPSIEVNSSETPVISIENGAPETAPKKNYSSPYPNYDDLKPPSSPTPTPSGLIRKPVMASTSDPTGSLASDQSPDLVDITPPSSPSPNASTVPENDIPEAPVDEKPEDIADHNGSRSRPLSPYTMYEDLKPPSSPVPSPRKC